MYKTPKYAETSVKRNESFQGETIETKIERIVQNKEPIKDGSPIIYTERKDGVLKAYNIKTDRWEVAVEAMDTVSKTESARRMERQKEREVINLNPEGKPTEGTNE